MISLGSSFLRNDFKSNIYGRKATTLQTYTIQMATQLLEEICMTEHHSNMTPSPCPTRTATNEVKSQQQNQAGNPQ